MAIYSGFFEYGGRGHVTMHYNPGKKCFLPCSEGTEVKIRVIGKYSDTDIDADIVEVILPSGQVLKEQRKGTLLHVTRATRNGVSPVQSGIRATKNPHLIKKVTPYTIRAKAGFFKGGKR